MALADLLLNQKSQGPWRVFRTGAKRNGPLMREPARKKKKTTDELEGLRVEEDKEVGEGRRKAVDEVFWGD